MYMDLFKAFNNVYDYADYQFITAGNLNLKSVNNDFKKHRHTHSGNIFQREDAKKGIFLVDRTLRGGW